MSDLSMLVEVPAGPALAAALARVDPDGLDAEGAVAFAAACRRQIGFYEAGQHKAVAAFAADDSGCDGLDRRQVAFVHFGGQGTPVVSEFAASEWAAEWGCASESASMRVGDAVDLVYRLPNTLAALGEGVIDGFRAQTLARTTRHLDPDVVKLVEADVLGRAATVTVGRLRGLVEAAVLRYDPDTVEADREADRRQLDVLVGPSQDGICEVSALVEAGAAIRLRARVQQVADWLFLAGDTRPVGPRRSAALAMLADPATVQTLFDRTHPNRQTSADDDDPPAPVGSLPGTVVYVHHTRRDDGTTCWSLDGAGPITQTEAADLVGGGGPVTVKPVIDLADMAEGAGYQPSPRLREAVQLTNPTLVFPYCPRNAKNCDLDHTIEWPRGPTTADNLGPLCRHHHRLKTHTGWQLAQPFNGTYIWRTPTGRTYLVDHHGTHGIPG